MGDKAHLNQHWDVTRYVLLTDIQTGKQNKIENAIYALVSLGNEDVLTELKRIIIAHGSKDIAQTYLNCGNNELRKAAESWAAERGYQILGGGNVGQAIWGHF